MGNLTKKALLKHLNKSDKEDIIREVVTLFDKFKNVKEFYKSELAGEGNPMLSRYKRKIEEAYNKPNPKERTTNINLNKLIKEFKKVSIYDRELADLMLYRVECGVAAIKRDNKRTSTFYNCIISTFEDAVKLIMADRSIDEFQSRINKIIKESSAGKFEMKERMQQVLGSLR
jgi:hypothetical protein